VFLNLHFKNIEYVNIEFLNSKKSDILYKELYKIIKLYSSRGLSEQILVSDRKLHTQNHVT